jgi:hypothetical protein
MVTAERHIGAAGGVHDERSLAIALAIAGFAVSAIFALQNPDGIVQFDDLTHYLYARWSWKWPAYLLNDWGRPGFTVIYFLPAGLGWTACRMLSAALSAGAALGAYEIARRIGLRHAWLAVPLVYLQPLFFQLSQTTLTETPTAFYLTIAVALALHGRWSLSAALLSLTFVTRYETVMFLPVWGYFARRSRISLWKLWPIVLAPLAVNVFAPIVGARPPIERLFIPAPSSQYGRGGWLTFFCRSLEAWGPGITVLAMTGFAALARRRGGALVAVCIATYFIMQTVIRALGLYDSGGYARFLVPISPLIGVAALSGLESACSPNSTTWRRAALVACGSMALLWVAMERQLVLYAARIDLLAELPELHQAVTAIRIITGSLAVLTFAAIAISRASALEKFARAMFPMAIIVTIFLAVYALCHPVQRPSEARLIDDARAWLSDHGLGGREIISANVWLDYVTRRDLPPDRPTVREQIVRSPVGTLVAWERQFAGSPYQGLSLAEFSKSPFFRLVHETPPAPFHAEPYLTIFEKIGPWEGK